ncbi:N-acetylated-alpha-linked acidic dipeptidase 2-like [Rhopilema esculentum]|uniref:N-acetylated-alpha-linked acidic dipeptidase 2-like n=1 Tax=Rhopilema esculentum TaxID=499914 RepID=UPI0031DD4288|eukprot:gene758-10482_t
MSLHSVSVNGKYILITALLLSSLVIGCLIGYAIKTRSTEKDRIYTSSNAEEKETTRFQQHKEVIDEMDAKNIEKDTKYLSNSPRMSGSRNADVITDYVATKWRNFGLETVKIHKYDVLLSYPENPAQITSIAVNGTVFNFTIRNPATGSKANGIVSPFHAYSPSGNVSGYLVYANYGTEQDFKELNDNGVSVTGKIVIMRHGFPYRGQQVDYASLNGAVGVILFSDPMEMNPNGNDAMYPNGWELPDSGIQIGTVLETTGDPLTRGYPSKQDFYRLNVSKASPLPSIPSQPVAFKDAKVLLQAMDGKDASKHFQGAGGFTYKLNSSLLIRMNIQNKLEVKTLSVISGVIYGNVEPDRYVLIGSHRDSWAYGASDASGAQATLVEIARCLGKARLSGWRPRRSIMFLSWDGHEHGMHGSTEWVEEHASMLQEQAVAYLNIDVAVEGNYTIDLRSTPELNDVLFDETKTLTEPVSKINLYEDWIRKSPSPSEKNEPRTIVLITGSDYKPFYHTIGVSSVDLKYTYAKTRGTRYPLGNPMYHSTFDTFDWLKKFIDPDFGYHLLIGKLWMKTTLNLADSTILRFNLTRAANAIYNYAVAFKNRHDGYISPQNISCDLLVNSAWNLTLAAKDFDARVKKVNKNEDMKVRMVNDRLQNFQRQLIHQTGTMGRDDLKNVVYSTRWDLLTTRTKFTAISEAIFRAVNGIDKDWDQVKRQLMIATNRLQAASQSYKTSQI